MMSAAFSHAPYEAKKSDGTAPLTSRAAFEAFFTRWLPRVYRFAARQLPTQGEAEAATRVILEAAVRARLVGADGEIAIRLLAIARAEIARRRRGSA